ncbi:MAG: oligosaccharide flippase family protein [Acidobacteriota bacterium]|jgi:O-antigen/teichoic acid export membrane protein|nr:oligosaccharide flippase family protein [Acidobacteriota bacterium]
MLRRLFNTSVYISLSRAMTTGTNLAVMFFVSRFLGAEKLGAYGICFALMYLVYTLTSFNLEVVLGKEAAVCREDPQRMSDLYGNAVTAFLAGLLITLPVWGIAQWIYADLSPQLLALAALCGLLLGLDMNLNGFLLGLERAGVETAVNLGSSLLLLFPLAIWPDHFGLTGVFALRAAGSALGIAVKAVIMRPFRRKGSIASRLDWFRDIRYYWLDHIAGYFLRQADILLLSFFVGLEELGVYFLALRIYLAVGILAEVGARATVPFFSRTFHGMESIAMGKLLRRMLLIFSACGVLLGIILATCGGWLISLFRPALDSGGVWLRWLALAVPLRMGKFILSAFMSSSRYQKQQFLVHLFSAGTLVLLTIILGVFFSTPGVLAARLASEAWGFVLATAVVFWRLPESRELRHNLRNVSGE